MRTWFDAVNARRRWLQGVLLSIVASRVRADIHCGADTRWLEVKLGRSIVRLAVRGTTDVRRAFINVHENEHTSVEAAREVLAARHDSGDRLIVLHGQGRRNIVFWIGLRPHLFDPNRIFSDRGIESTLRYHGAYSRAAHTALAGLRDAVVELLQPERTAMIVALHNNGIGHYTIESYLPGGSEAGDAEAVHVDGRADPGDFFLVTQQATFDALRDSGFGVVLQRRHVADDGSMSHHFAGARSAYVNVEARHGHLREQRLMLEALLDRTSRMGAV